MNGSYISATTGELHGIPAAEPILQLAFNVEVGGLSDGASALFLIGGSIHADSGLNLSLGTAAPVLRQLGFSAREGGTAPYTTQVHAQWTLSDAAIERIEKIRNGGGLVIYPDVQYALISPGTTMPGWPQPHRPIRVPGPGQPTSVRVDSHQWVQTVLEKWQLAAAVSLVVALPAGTVTDEHRTIVARLATAKRLLTAGKLEDLKASIAASPRGLRVAPRDAPHHRQPRAPEA